jgi:hypothetical protein
VAARPRRGAPVEGWSQGRALEKRMPERRRAPSTFRDGAREETARRGGRGVGGSPGGARVARRRGAGMAGQGGRAEGGGDRHVQW